MQECRKFSVVKYLAKDIVRRYFSTPKKASCDSVRHPGFTAVYGLQDTIHRRQGRQHGAGHLSANFDVDRRLCIFLSVVSYFLASCSLCTRWQPSEFTDLLRLRVQLTVVGHFHVPAQKRSAAELLHDEPRGLYASHGSFSNKGITWCYLLSCPRGQP